MSLHFDIQKLLAYGNLCIRAGFPYVFGAKPELDADPSEIQGSDCSGFSRYLAYHSTYHSLILPEGSAQQEEWCASNLEDCGYLDSVNGAIIAFHEGSGIGHVWFVIHGLTLECYGGHGPGRRQWNTTMDGMPAQEFCTSCYLLP